MNPRRVLHLAGFQDQCFKPDSAMAPYVKTLHLPSLFFLVADEVLPLPLEFLGYSILFHIVLRIPPVLFVSVFPQEAIQFHNLKPHNLAVAVVELVEPHCGKSVLLLKLSHRCEMLQIGSLCSFFEVSSTGGNRTRRQSLNFESSRFTVLRTVPFMSL